MNEDLLELVSGLTYDACDTFIAGGRDAEPKRCKLSDVNNDIYDARLLGDEERLEQLKSLWEDLYRDYLATESRLHPVPRYVQNVMRAGNQHAFLDWEGAAGSDLKAYEGAADPPPGCTASKEELQKCLAIAASNLCSDYRQWALMKEDEEERSELLDDAIAWGRKSLTHNPSDPFTVVELAMAYDDNGDPETANKLLQVVVPHVDFDNPRCSLAARLRYEVSLLERLHLSAVRDLVAKAH
jgi:hypothetical protein